MSNTIGNNTHRNLSIADIAISALALAIFAYLLVFGPTPESAAGGGTVVADVVTVPIVWGDLGSRLIATGVIDRGRIEKLYASRGDLSGSRETYLYGSVNDELTVTQEDAPFMLTMLWAFGLANQNAILEKGPMTDVRFGGDAGAFASTGGWTLSANSSMEHYAAHALVPLTDEEQERVKRVSMNVYRPCCNNPAYFPDCNHGMAMLGALELMAAQGVEEEDMYRYALGLNRLWFPDAYAVARQYYEDQGTAWADVDPREALGVRVSSASGYRAVRSVVDASGRGSGESCAV